MASNTMKSFRGAFSATWRQRRVVHGFGYINVKFFFLRIDGFNTNVEGQVRHILSYSNPGHRMKYKVVQYACSVFPVTTICPGWRCRPLSKVIGVVNVFIDSFHGDYRSFNESNHLVQSLMAILQFFIQRHKLVDRRSF